MNLSCGDDKTFVHFSSISQNSTIHEKPYFNDSLCHYIYIYIYVCVCVCVHVCVCVCGKIVRE